MKSWTKGARGDGDIAEMLAAAWLIRAGYVVARCVASRQEYDLIATKDNTIFFIDVKKSSQLEKKKKRLDEQIISKPRVSILLADFESYKWYSKVPFEISGNAE